MATLQQQVQQHLTNTGISLRKLSRQAFVSHTTIGKILRGGEYKNGTADALRIAMQPKTLDATIEQLAVQRIDADLTHVRDTDLECAKYRRVMQLEQQLNDANTAYLSSKSQHERDLQRLDDALIEANEKIAKREAWIERLQKQLDYSNQKINELYAAYDQQVDDETEMLAQIDTLFAERENATTLHDQQIMRLRAYVWILIAALVFVLVSGLVVWGGV